MKIKILLSHIIQSYLNKEMNSWTENKLNTTVVQKIGSLSKDYKRHASMWRVVLLIDNSEGFTTKL